LETRENIEGRPAGAAAISFLLTRKYNLDDFRKTIQRSGGDVFSFNEEV
jgi:hypothetical protein